MSDNETLADIVNAMRDEYARRGGSFHGGDAIDWLRYADRFEAAAKREADSIERIVRDAIIDYSEQYVNAPNDDVERELKERAARGNAWLVAHGFAEEKVFLIFHSSIGNQTNGFSIREIG